MARQLRFYVPDELLVGNRLKISDEKARHITQVLRLEEGAEFILFNGDSKEYLAQLAHVSKKSTSVVVLSAQNVNRESTVRVHLIQGLSKGDRMDATIQKCVELGVQSIFPVNTSRSNLKINDMRMEKKHSHWLGVIHAACEQSGRNVIPLLEKTGQFKSSICQFDQFDGLKFILHPGGDKRLSQLQMPTKAVVLAVGPEGGFCENELQYALEHGFQQLSLGARILRTETAAMSVIAGIQAKWGDI